MGDKFRGAFAILVGLFALYQSYTLYVNQRRDWHLWLELGAGTVLLCLGIWRIARKPVDPLKELLK